MKKLLYTVVVVAVMVFGFTFTFLNSQPVEIQTYPGAHWKGPLSILLFVTWVPGAPVGCLLSLLYLFQGAPGASAG